MGHIFLRPELVTTGGEACGIMFDDQHVGSLTLLYREEDRMYGSVQLDEESLDIEEKEEIDQFLHRYIENKIDALSVPECLVTVTYSEYDHIISVDDIDDIEEAFEEEDDEEEIQLMIAGESRNKVEYQLLNKTNDLIAEAVLDINRGDVSGDVYWHYEPTDEEIDEIAQIIVSDFDSDLIDSFTFHMLYENEEIVTIHLDHTDFFDEDEELILETDEEHALEDEELYVDVYGDEDVPISIELIRDDVDTLTFDIYEGSERQNSRLGTITLILESEEVTALVDFINPRDKDIREQIAYQLVQQLEDNKIGYETITITMKYNEEEIDEFVFDIKDQLQPV